MRVLVFGSGSFARKHAEILSGLDDVEVTAFCSRTVGHAAAAAADLSTRTGRSVEAYTDTSEAIDAEKPDAAVIVVTPNGHGEIEIELVRRKVPFLVEKPIGVEPEHPRRIAEAVADADLITSAAFHLRYLDTTEALDAMLKATTPVIANGYWMSTLPPPAWWRHIEESGGQFVEQTVHIVDLVRALFGEFESVYAHTSKRVLPDMHADADVPDAGVAVLQARRGLTVTLINSCVGPGSMRVGLEVVTPVALFEFLPSLLRVRREFETTERRPELDPYRVEDAAFIEAVRTGDASGIRSPYADALLTHELTMAIVASSTTGQPVVL